MNLSRILIGLALLLAHVVNAWAMNPSDLGLKSAPSPQDICAERYEISSNYNAFGRASIITPAATPDKPTIQVNLRLPGQYEDAESGLHYNYRRFYDPETGRYLTQDPIGLEGGINLFSYAQADPINLTDPTGEIVPVVVAGAVCMASCMAATAAEDVITGECTTVGTSAKNCAIGCAMGGVGALAMKVGKWAKRAYDNLPCALKTNSFPADTLVHVQPSGIASEDSNPDQAAASGKSQLKPISQLQPGDKVLALSEWKDAVNKLGQDQRLTYEKVTDVFTSHREQTHVFLTLDNGQTIQATEGHPFLTSEGWRDAVLLKRGGKLLIKGDGSEADKDAGQEVFNKAIYKENQPVAVINTAQSATENIVKTTLSSDANQAAGSYRTILDIRTERQTVPVFNIEVANAHTFFVVEEGVLVHNGGCNKAKYLWQKACETYWKSKGYVDGKPPTRDVRVRDNKTGREYDRTERKELHHKDPQRNSGSNDPKNLNEVWPTEHANIDPYRRPGYEIVKVYK
jgi:RHS repeat-associated protein